MSPTANASQGDSARGSFCTCVSKREVIRGHQRSSEVIRGHQRPSEVIRGHQRSSEAIRGHQRPSEAIRGHQRSSDVIKRHQKASEVIRGHQRPPVSKRATSAGTPPAVAMATPLLCSLASECSAPAAVSAARAPPSLPDEGGNQEVSSEII